MGAKQVTTQFFKNHEINQAKNDVGNSHKQIVGYLQ